MCTTKEASTRRHNTICHTKSALREEITEFARKTFRIDFDHWVSGEYISDVIDLKIKAGELKFNGEHFEPVTKS